MKQSGREWNRKLNTTLQEFGFERTKADYCVYTRRREGKLAIITVWVDDLLLLTEGTDEMKGLKENLKAKFEVSDMGEPKLLIGFEVTRDRENRTVTIGQKNYVAKVLRQYQMDNANPVAMPLDPNIILTRHEGEPEAPISPLTNYAAIVGSLMYAAVGTRPDIAYAVQTLSKFTSNPGPQHWTVLKRVLRYLIGTCDYVIRYGLTPEPDLPMIFTTYCDADHTADTDDRKSISGYTVLVGGGAVAWSSKKQTTVALSSTEAEYSAIAHATRQIIWLRYLFDALGYPQDDPSLLFSDNGSAIALTGNPQFHMRSKHFDIQNHFVREKTEEEIIEVVYCPTNEMVADIFTKGLPKPKHQKFVRELGLLPA